MSLATQLNESHQSVIQKHNTRNIHFTKTESPVYIFPRTATFNVRIDVDRMKNGMNQKPENIKYQDT